MRRFNVVLFAVVTVLMTAMTAFAQAGSADHPVDNNAGLKAIAAGVGFAIAVVQLAVTCFINPNSVSNSFKDFILTNLLIYAYVLSVPTTVDRSYTVRLLRYLSETPGGASREQIARFYVSDFVNHGAIERRLAEQQATGTIVRRGDMYVLTRKGTALDLAFKLTCRAYVCENPVPKLSDAKAIKLDAE